MGKKYNPQKSFEKLLLEIINRRIVLFVGAGISVSLGYPSWPKLIEELKDQFCSETIFPIDSDELDKADLIQEELKKGKDDLKLEPYHQYLLNRFSPNEQQVKDYHCDLVRLPNRGIITTNYDRVIEDAIQNSIHLSSESDAIQFLHIESLNMCDKHQKYEILKFIRGLSSLKNGRSVLHAHGDYTKPENIILSRGEYKKYYESDLIANPDSRILDMFHRKVLWSIASNHPLLFVGFSMDDPYFTPLLEVVKTDFNVFFDNLHYAILPKTSDDDEQEIYEKLKQYAVLPIFYQKSPDGGHVALETLISDLYNTSITAPPVQDKTMLNHQGQVPIVSNSDTSDSMESTNLDKLPDLAEISLNLAGGKLED